MLTINGLNQYYGESHILHDVNLEIPSGQCTCLMGRNSVGKTTLLGTIMGLIAARTGSVIFGGQDISRLPTEQRALAGIGYVPQGREIFAQLTVEQNLRVAMSARGQFSSVLPGRILDLFPVLRDMLRRRGGDLSGGQQQQLAIARALVLAPKLLVLDEPTEGIQPNIITQIGDVLRQLVEEDNMTVLLVEQKLPFARRNAKAFFVMDKGAVVAGGQIEQLNDEIARKHLSV
jgi:urea transport system ATP-binding protein